MLAAIGSYRGLRFNVDCSEILSSSIQDSDVNTRSSIFITSVLGFNVNNFFFFTVSGGIVTIRICDVHHLNVRASHRIFVYC